MVRSNIPSSLTVQDATALSATPGTAAASKAVILDASADLSSGINDFAVDNDLAVGNDASVAGDLAVTGDVSAATGTITDLTPSGYTAVARTATDDGLTTGTIADAGSYQFVQVTSASANNIIVLPAPTPGTVVELAVGANGYELRSSAPTTVLIGGGTGGAAVESAIPANSVARLFCVDATHWVGYTITGATLAAVEAAA